MIAWMSAMIGTYIITRMFSLIFPLGKEKESPNIIVLLLAIITIFVTGFAVYTVFSTSAEMSELLRIFE